MCQKLLSNHNATPVAEAHTFITIYILVFKSVLYTIVISDVLYTLAIR